VESTDLDSVWLDIGKIIDNYLLLRFSTSRAQARNQGGAGGAKPPLENFSPSLEKCVGHRLKLLDIVQNIWAPLNKLFAPPGVPRRPTVSSKRTSVSLYDSWLLELVYLIRTKQRSVTLPFSFQSNLWRMYYCHLNFNDHHLAVQ